MLKLISVPDPASRRIYLQKFSPAQSTWIVSDLASKSHLRSQLLEKVEFLHGESVLRISELWSLLCRRKMPDLQVISPQFMSVLITDFLLKAERPAWAQTPGASARIYTYLTQLLPILSHPEGMEIGGLWLEKHPEAQSRWGDWFPLAVELWQHLSHLKLTTLEWLPGLLVNQTSFASVWKRGLIFDLGSDLTQVEADLIVTLSDAFDVEVLYPSASESPSGLFALQAYEIFKQRVGVQKIDLVREDQIHLEARTFRKFTTMLSEVKDACSQVRSWLNDGLAPSRIAVAAPNIELYWPALSAYFRTEGIPVQKPLVGRLQSFSDVAFWLAKLRVKLGRIESSDLELSLFNSENKFSKLSYERFQSLFASIYSSDDLLREKNVYDFIQEQSNAACASTDLISRDVFISWCLDSAPADLHEERLQRLLAPLLSEPNASTEMSLERWFSYFEKLAAQMEIVLQPEDSTGVFLINLISAKNIDVTKLYLLGITEKEMQRGADGNIIFSDIKSLADEFGFYLQHSDRNQLVFELDWLLSDRNRQFILSTAETNFFGDTEAASLSWIKGALATNRDIHELSEPQDSRWDEIQLSTRQSMASVRNRSVERQQILQQSLAEDLGELPLAPFAANKLKRFSASGLEDYQKCAFIFAAKRVFCLSDDPSLDLDLDPSTRGRFIHAIFRKLTEEPFKVDWTSEALNSLLDQTWREQEFEMGEPRLWEKYRPRFLALAQRFVRAENDWRERFPQTKTVGTESEINGFFDLEKADFLSLAESTHAHPENLIAVRGSIDRIDQDNSSASAIIDYKSSGFGLKSSQSWLDDDKLQLLLYTLAFERGLTAVASKDVVGAFYLVANELVRSKGFRVKDAEQNLFALDDRRQDKISLKEKEELLQLGREKIKKILLSIRAGEFSPAPKDIKDCEFCQWSAQCRVPHLNR